MEIKQNPFSLYDFLGYFVPGALLILGLIEIYNIFGPDELPIDFSKIETYLPFTLLSYVLGHLLSFFSSVTVEKYSIWKLGYPSKYLLGLSFPKYFDVREPKLARIFFRSVTALFLLPVSVLDSLLGDFLCLNELHAKSLDPVMIQILRKNVEDLFKPKANKSKSSKAKQTKKVNAADLDYFRFAYHYALENAPGHSQKMQNYVALYGFLRTLTLLAILGFWISFAYTWIEASSWLLPLALAALAYTICLDFNKFYRRFSLEILMAVSAVSIKN